MGNIRKTGTSKRHDDIFKRYETLLRKEMQDNAERAKRTSRIFIYEMIAEETGYSTDLISRVVRKRLRGTVNAQ